MMKKEPTCYMHFHHHPGNSQPQTHVTQLLQQYRRVVDVFQQHTFGQLQFYRTQVKRRGLRRVFETPDCEASSIEGNAYRAVANVFGLDPERAPVGPYILSGQVTSAAAMHLSVSQRWNR